MDDFRPLFISPLCDLSVHAHTRYQIIGPLECILLSHSDCGRGNSNGDIPMLQFARQESLPALRLLLLHDDPVREFDYVEGAEKSLELAHEY
jgi:hypothetical protein